MTTNLTHPNIQEFCKTRKCLTALLDKQNIKPKKFKKIFLYLLLDCPTTNFGPLLTIQFQPNVTGSLITTLGWVPKPNQAPSGIWTWNLLILSQCLNPLGHSLSKNTLLQSHQLCTLNKFHYASKSQQKYSFVLDQLTY